MKMKIHPSRTQKWDDSKHHVESILAALRTKGARFYRYTIHGVYVYVDHTLYNLEYKIQTRCLLHGPLGLNQLPDEKKICACLYRRIDGLAVDIPRGLGTINDHAEPDVGARWRSEQFDHWVQAVIGSGII
jgi:hypothetical protein